MLTKIGLDLGYANITMSSVTSEVYREPSVVLLDKNTRRVISVGSGAVADDEETMGEDGVLVRPFKNGLLYSSELTREIIKHTVSAIGVTDKLRCVIALPSDLISKQESEIFKMLTDAGACECYSVNSAVAALIGAGHSPTASAVSVNIGASSTEIAVLFEGEVILSHRENIGGEDFDRAVKDYILAQGDMTVSLLVARTIKERLGTVWQGRPNESIDIEGVLSLTGNKVSMKICTEDIIGVFESPLQRLLLTIADVVKRIPSDKVEAIFKNGIVISGGASQLYGLDIMIAKVLGISVTRPTDAIDCVSKGLARINTFIPLNMRGGARNITSLLPKLYVGKTVGKK